MFQSLVARIYGRRPCNNHEPDIPSQIVLMLSHNFSQATPNAIASNRASQVTRGDKAGPKQPGIPHNNRPKYQQLAPQGKAIASYVLKF